MNQHLLSSRPAAQRDRRDPSVVAPPAGAHQGAPSIERHELTETPPSRSGPPTGLARAVPLRGDAGFLGRPRLTSTAHRSSCRSDVLLLRRTRSPHSLIPEPSLCDAERSLSPPCSNGRRLFVNHRIKQNLRLLTVCVFTALRASRPGTASGRGRPAAPAPGALVCLPRAEQNPQRPLCQGLSRGRQAPPLGDSPPTTGSRTPLSKGVTQPGRAHLFAIPHAQSSLGCWLKGNGLAERATC